MYSNPDCSGDSFFVPSDHSEARCSACVDFCDAGIHSALSLKAGQNQVPSFKVQGPISIQGFPECRGTWSYPDAAALGVYDDDTCVQPPGDMAHLKFIAPPTPPTPLPDPGHIRSWTGAGTSIAHIPSGSSGTVVFAADFTCDYDSEIPIPTGTNVTIHGNGAVLDATRKGRFFNVNSGGTLALDHLTLQHGSVSDNVSAGYLPPSVPGLAQTCYIPGRDFTTFFLFSNFSVAICTVRRSDQQQRDPDCQIRQFHRQLCLQCMCNSSP